MVCTNTRIGTARLALGFAKKMMGTGITAPIIPVGLNYVSKDRFRSQVMVQFGEPIYLTPEDIQNPKESSVRLTKNIESSIKACTINAETWDELNLLGTAHQIYTSNHKLTLDEDIRVLHRFVQSYEALKSNDEVLQLRTMLDSYKQELDNLGLPDYVLSRKFKSGTIISHLLKRSVKLLISIILGIPGLLLCFPMHLLGRILSSYEVYIESKCQIRFGLMILMIPTLFSVYLGLIYHFVGLYTTFWSFLIIPLFGYLYVLELEEGTRNFRGLFAVMKLVKVLSVDQSRFDRIYQVRKNIYDRICHIANQLYDKESKIVATKNLIKSEDGVLEAGVDHVHIQIYNNSNN
eukprot:TRINITY_DN2774_c0_g4_i1.p1 TRINITY_DN2774_c0_g4~~TRINITY_DN2774_c0_g4_i1.p1  ORF type:complete len:349 (-),score=32.42 TRINITY_DN2774_c0_g4_i1:146-1192(-)